MTDTFYKDPDAVLDYGWDWSDWLEGGEIISTYLVTVPSGITKDSDSKTDSIVTAWLSGGTLGEIYTVLCHIVTDAGREDDRTIYVAIRNK
jgi:hypothetical protein